MKIVFYESHELFSVLDSYLKKYQDDINFIICDEGAINLFSIFLKNLKIKFNICQENFSLIQDNYLIRILNSIIYFIENEFSIKYFFEISALIESDLSKEFLRFFQINLINEDSKINNILKFKNLKILHHNLFLDIIDWCRNLKKFYLSNKKISLVEFYLKIIELIDELFFVFQYKNRRKLSVENFNLESNCLVNKFKTTVDIYFELMKSQKVYFNSFEQSNNIIISFLSFEINHKLVEESINVFYFIRSEEELKNFFNSKISKIRGEKRSNFILFVDSNLKNLTDEFTEIYSEIRKYKFLNPLLCEDTLNANSIFNINTTNKVIKNKDFSEFYLFEIKKSRVFEKNILLNSSSIYRLISDEKKFIKKDILKYEEIKKANEDYLISGYLDFPMRNIIEKFLHNSDLYLPLIIKEEIERNYHEAYFGYLYDRLQTLIANFIVCFNDIKSFSKNNYEMKFNQKIRYKIRISDKIFEIKSSAFIILENENEIIVYDFFSKGLEKNEFCNFKKPNIILLGLYLMVKFQYKKISLRYYNLDEESKEKVIKNSHEVIENLKKIIARKMKKIIK